MCTSRVDIWFGWPYLTAVKVWLKTLSKTLSLIGCQHSYASLLMIIWTTCSQMKTSVATRWNLSMRLLKLISSRTSSTRRSTTACLKLAAQNPVTALPAVGPIGLNDVIEIAHWTSFSQTSLMRKKHSKLIFASCKYETDIVDHK